MQGGVPEDLGRYLVQQHGVPKKYIEVRTAEIELASGSCE